MQADCSFQFPKSIVSCHHITIFPVKEKVSRPDPACRVRVLVEVLNGSSAHHRQPTLQLCQILSAERLVRRSGTPGHDRGNHSIQANKKRT